MTAMNKAMSGEMSQAAPDLKGGDGTDTKSILLVGVGGQGTILASKILTIGLMEAGFDVKMSEIHGMSQRGGSVSSHVRYGRKVCSPVIEKGTADMIVAFEKMEALRYLDYLKKNTRNGVLRQALISDCFNEFIDQNETEMFEELYPYFTKNVDNPILKLSTRDRYLSRKAFKDDPRALTNAILYPDRHSDATRLSARVDEGVEFLRDRVEENERKVIYINIGAHWCRGCVEERPYLWKMAETFQDEPLKIVNIIIGSSDYPDRDSLTTFGTMIEDYHLTDEQFSGIDHIVKLGNNGIPYYILINKEGLIVDYGGHLRPSSQSTLDKIRALLESE